MQGRNYVRTPTLLHRVRANLPPLLTTSVHSFTIFFFFLHTIPFFRSVSDCCFVRGRFTLGRKTMLPI